MSSFPYVIPSSLLRFVHLSAPPSLPTKTGWNKQMDRPVRKAGLFTFHFAGLQLVYRNFCCELYFRSSPMLLFFASDIPPAPSFFQMVFSVTLSLTQMRRHAVLLYPDQGAEGKHGTSTYTIQSSKQHTVSTIHYCQGFF